MHLKAIPLGLIGLGVLYWRVAAAFKWAEDRLDDETRAKG